MRYKGAKSVVITPDYSEAAKFSDLWLHPKQGTDAALAMAMGHVILKEFHLSGRSDYFAEYCRANTDMPMLVALDKKGDAFVPGRLLRACDLDGALGQANNPEWKTLAFDADGSLALPNGSIGFRWGESGKWNIEERDARDGRAVKLALTLADRNDGMVSVAFPYFGGTAPAAFVATGHEAVLHRNVPARIVQTKDGPMRVVTVFDLMAANYGVDRGFGGGNVAATFDNDVPHSPAWAEAITGVDRRHIISVAREFAENADKTRGKSMVILGAGLNHWYHMDMIYRGIINVLVMCGCVGQSGGGWSHYVGQEKLRPQTGWTALAFALDWNRPPRQMNSTSFFYAHTSQWRYEELESASLLSPLADADALPKTLIDCNVKAERMGWLPSAPQLAANPLRIADAADAAGQRVPEYVAAQVQSGALQFAAEDPDAPVNFPRNMFVWRSNLLGASGKGHEYFLKYLLGAEHSVLGKDLGVEGGQKPEEVRWQDQGAEGKLDLLVTLDFRMSTTCMFSDIVLPTATWYEKHDLNTSDMHPFIHPLSAAIDPVWEARSDWEIYKGIAKKFSEVAHGHLAQERDTVLTPIMHDSAGELAQPFAVQDWKKGECPPIPGKTMPNVTVVERDYPATYEKFTSLGPLMEKLGNGGKGIGWNTAREVKQLGQLNGIASNGRPRIETDIDAAEVILSLAPETNGEVAVRAWEALNKQTGREHTHLARAREDDKIRFRDLQAQPRKIISSPTWSGLESKHVSYNAGYTNVHERIPWRTLTGRQQFYQDHVWMRAMGEALALYRPPVDTQTIASAKHLADGRPSVVLNFITPHQKWGIHSTYTDNLLMLTLSRGGPIVWISETDARAAGIEDNDWIEAFNANGALTARACVSQRVPPGMCMMYHAQEKIVNVPGSEITGKRGGIHNSVTRTCPRPTHMIGGYAQLSYGFNYYGTVGANRDEFVIVAKWKKSTGSNGRSPTRRTEGERS